MDGERKYDAKGRRLGRGGDVVRPRRPLTSNRVICRWCRCDFERPEVPAIVACIACDKPGCQDLQRKWEETWPENQSTLARRSTVTPDADPVEREKLLRIGEGRRSSERVEIIEPEELN